MGDNEHSNDTAESLPAQQGADAVKAWAQSTVAGIIAAEPTGPAFLRRLVSLAGMMAGDDPARADALRAALLDAAESLDRNPTAESLEADRMFVAAAAATAAAPAGGVTA